MGRIVTSLDLKNDSSPLPGQKNRVCQGIPYCGRNSRNKKAPLTIAEWNIRTLMDAQPQLRPHRRTALVAHELNRYNVDIAALSETRLPGDDSLKEMGEGYTFFWKGYEDNERRIHGVGFAIRSSLLARTNETPIGISARLMSWRIPLAKHRFLTLISAYAPTLDTDENQKDIFYETLDRTLAAIPKETKCYSLATSTPELERMTTYGQELSVNMEWVKPTVMVSDY